MSDATPAPAPQPRTPVLVVGRDEMIVALAEHGLTEAGFDVTTATDGHDAQRLAQRTAPSVVVVDLGDVADAVQLVRRFRSLGGHAARARFVFLPLRGTPQEALAELRGEGHGFVSKPFRLDVLVSAVTAQATKGTVVRGERRRRRYVVPVAVSVVAGLAAATALAVLLPDGSASRTPATHVGSQAFRASSSPTPSAAPSTRPAPTPTPTPTPATVHPNQRQPAADLCTDPRTRGSQALRLLRDERWIRAVRVSFRSGRAGVLAVGHPRANEVVVYVRPCDREPLQEVAAAAVDQVAQVRAARWTSADERSWLRLRGHTGASHPALEQDVGAVAILWQLRTTRWWRSPFAPPDRVSPDLVSLLRK